MKVSALLILFFFFSIILPAMAQQSEKSELPYYELPAYPAAFTAANVAARMVDGLGFRYYWATEGLRQEDLDFKPSSEARTTEQTVDHILGLTQTILNSVIKAPNERVEDPHVLSFEEKRRQTLENIKQTSDILKAATDDELNEFKIVFKNGEQTTEYPFWNQLNGPIADAIWHCGQIVSFRRSSGNPYNNKASVFTGKVRE